MLRGWRRREEKGDEERMMRISVFKYMPLMLQC